MTLCQTHFTPTKAPNHSEETQHVGVDLLRATAFNPTIKHSNLSTIQTHSTGLSTGGGFPAGSAEPRPAVTPTSCLGTFQINFPQITSRINLRQQATGGTGRCLQ